MEFLIIAIPVVLIIIVIKISSDNLKNKYANNELIKKCVIEHTNQFIESIKRMESNDRIQQVKKHICTNVYSDGIAYSYGHGYIIFFADYHLKNLTDRQQKAVARVLAEGIASKVKGQLPINSNHRNPVLRITKDEESSTNLIIEYVAQNVNYIKPQSW